MTKQLLLRPIAVTMCLIAIVVMGCLALHYIPVSLMPDIDVPQITVQANMPGFSAHGMFQVRLLEWVATSSSRGSYYLAEILMWWSIGLLSVLTMGENYILLIGAFLNTCLFMFVSIPLADRRQSRKEGFIEYKNETRMLLPIRKFKKRNVA